MIYDLLDMERIRDLADLTLPVVSDSERAELKRWRDEAQRMAVDYAHAEIDQQRAERLDTFVSDMAAKYGVDF